MSKNGCKINLYSLLDLQLKKCFWRGNSFANILGLEFTNQDKFMALISNTFTVHIYSLEDIEKNIGFVEKENYKQDDYCLTEDLGVIRKSRNNIFTKIKVNFDFIHRIFSTIQIQVLLNTILILKNKSKIEVIVRIMIIHIQ